MREHIHAAHLYPPDILPPGSVPDPSQVSGRFAGHTNHVADAKIQTLSDRLRMDSIARRIQNDQIRLFFQPVHHLEGHPPPEIRSCQVRCAPHSARAASTASPTISTPTTFSATGASDPAPSCRCRCKGRIRLVPSFLTHILTRFLVQHLRAQSSSVWKKENGEIWNRSPKSSFVKMLASEQNVRPLIFYGIRQCDQFSVCRMPAKLPSIGSA